MGKETDSNEVAPQGDSASVNGVRKTTSKLSTLASKYSSPATTPVQSNNSFKNSTEKFDTSDTDSTNMADLAPSLLEFDQDIVGGNLAEFLQHAQGLGGEIAEHAALIRKAFGAQRNFLAVATRYAKPNDAEFQKLLTDTANAINEIQQFREKRRASPVFNHLSGVSESIPALAWVTIAPTPAPYIKEMNDAGQFYTNRVLKDFKDKPGHAEWARSWVALLTNLQTHVRKHHTTGLVWGKQPYAGGGAVPPPPAGGPPPPPPPPAFDLDLDNLNVSDDRAALFQELNRGENVTKGLKKVTSEMQTHKNPNLRAGGVVPEKGGASANHTSAPKAPTVKPPKLILEGKKWVVEHQIGQKELKIENVEMNQVVYMFGCKNSTIQIKGKLNSIVVDSCIKTAVVFDSLVASVEFVNCRDCQTQVMGTVPTITIDKVDGLQMFLSKDSLQVEIVSAKSSALNVMVPQASGDYAEWPIPEQFKTTIGPKGLVTISTESVGV
ncbi:unnamed protein product [Allacma fusca]|uniref:C-CAP/cofactor C-like domain-containing protein n=1 Tax=Allacma fusca TaxID=39272 RepID=A0A8J2K316_9HEXA|nr:unnamed protein product [Allacma fusca]